MVMFEIGMAIIMSFIWLLGFIFVVLMTFFMVGFIAAILSKMYNYINPGKE